ncbi:hypothetical protein D021_1913A, partial [Vibrio parahaemolyticus 10296]
MSAIFYSTLLLPCKKIYYNFLIFG